MTTLHAPELRHAGERDRITTSTGIVIGGAYVPRRHADFAPAVTGPYRRTLRRRLRRAWQALRERC